TTTGPGRRGSSLTLPTGTLRLRRLDSSLRRPALPLTLGPAAASRPGPEATPRRARRPGADCQHWRPHRPRRPERLLPALAAAATLQQPGRERLVVSDSAGRLPRFRVGCGLARRRR